MQEHIKSIQDSIRVLVASHIQAGPWKAENISSLVTISQTGMNPLFLLLLSPGWVSMHVMSCHWWLLTTPFSWAPAAWSWQAAKTESVEEWEEGTISEEQGWVHAALSPCSKAELVVENKWVVTNPCCLWNHETQTILGWEVFPAHCDCEWQVQRQSCATQVPV